MAVEIAPVLGCATCAGPLCPACLGCMAAGHAAGCRCLNDDVIADRVAARREWLEAARTLGNHIDNCFPCSLPWATDCDEGQALRVAADAAWTRYDGGPQ